MKRHAVPAPSRLFAYVSFAVMAGGWLAFAAALVVSRQTLADVWSWVGDLPLLLEGLTWLLGFPFLVGLAIWRAAWDESLRLVLIGVLALACTYMFRPRRASDS